MRNPTPPQSADQQDALLPSEAMSSESIALYRAVHDSDDTRITTVLGSEGTRTDGRDIGGLGGARRQALEQAGALGRGRCGGPAGVLVGGRRGGRAAV